MDAPSALLVDPPDDREKNTWAKSPILVSHYSYYSGSSNGSLVYSSNLTFPEEVLLWAFLRMYLINLPKMAIF